MLLKVFSGIMIPFIGTMLGSSAIFLFRKDTSVKMKNILSALAGGIMLAASVWSLLLPSIEMEDGGVLQTVAGFISGVVSMIWADRIVDKLLGRCDKYTPYATNTLMQFIAVTVHNIPEGMAVGMVFASLLASNVEKDFTSAFLLSFGIAAQNIPEGAIVTMPLITENKSRKKTFLLGFVSGIVEPIGAVIAILASNLMSAILPFFLSFAAGAMIYVITEQLIPDMYENREKKGSVTLVFSVGFLLMMSLDIIFG